MLAHNQTRYVPGVTFCAPALVAAMAQLTTDSVAILNGLGRRRVDSAGSPNVAWNTERDDGALTRRRVLSRAMTQTRFSRMPVRMLPAPDLKSAEQLLIYNARGKRKDLVRGRLLVREPAGYKHGSIAARVLTRIAMFLKQDQAARFAAHPLGEVLPAHGYRPCKPPKHPDLPQAPIGTFARPGVLSRPLHPNP